MDSSGGKQSKRKQLVPVVLLMLLVLLIMYLPGILQFNIMPKIKRKNTMKRLKSQKVEVGDVLVFGEEEWTNTWLVLEVDGSKVLLINEKCVETRGFSGERSRTPYYAAWGMAYPYIAPGTPTSPIDVWKNSGLKSWLNVDYYTYAFSDEEKALITDRGLGKVFLLSADEVELFFPNENDRFPGGEKDHMPWWLRSGMRIDAGDREGDVYADYVSYANVIKKDEPCFNGSMIGVRPVIWLEMDPDAEMDSGK